MEPGQDERGREVRPRLLTGAVAVLAALLLVPAAAAAQAPTGRLLVTMKVPAGVPGARAAGYAVPQLGLRTVRPRPGRTLAQLERRLRADPRVREVAVEHRARPRLFPNDPALREPETAPGTPPGTPVEWWAARERFPAAWDVSTGVGATVAVIDTGFETSHPEFAGRIVATKSFDPGGPATSDPAGHGTHVASLACGAGDDGISLAGAGLRCRMLLIRSDFSDSSVIKSIVWAVDHGADAINMSFGTDPGIDPPQALRDAIRYAYDHGVVMAAAASDDGQTDQGYPADLLQPTGTGARIDDGLGLSVTAADGRDRRAPFAGRGSQISLAAYGTFSADGSTGRKGILGAFTTQTNTLETGDPLAVPPARPCDCRTTFDGDPRYAYVQGTSMSTPMVAATGALMRDLNPALPVGEIVRAIKRTARRSAGWDERLGWGILDAGAALRFARDADRSAPRSRATRGPIRGRALTLRWSGSDRGPRGVRASGIERYELWRSDDRARYRRVLSTTGRSAVVALKPGASARFFTIAVDRAGNREAKPSRPDVALAAR